MEISNMSNCYTKKDLKNAIEQAPSLAIGGFRVSRSDEEFVKNREQLGNCLIEFQLCCEWLSKQKILFRRGKNSENSYWLKHAVERYAQENSTNNKHTYISNGVLIAAVIHLNILYKRIPETPNSEVYIKILNPD